MNSASLFTLLFNIGTLCLVLGMLFIIWRLGDRRSHLLALGMGMAVLFFTVFLFPLYPGTQFGIIRLAAWSCFAHIPVYLIGLSVIFRSQSPQIAAAHLVLAGIILMVGVDAFVIEPHWLDVTRMSIQSSKINDPIRVVIVADIQTDRTGNYEERVMETALEQDPDVLLFAGDYIHIPWSNDGYNQEIENLNAILKGFDLDRSLGTYAIGGNVDRPEVWFGVFADLPVVVIGDTASYDLGPVYLTGLDLHDSFNTQVSVPEKDKFHIVLGHSPNFSLGDIEADLLLAGHTHGGQVQLPFIGPILTLSSVPRKWASGMTEISHGKTLVVSRGVGLERMDAPRMRFLCRPEIVVIDLVPA